MKKSIIRNLPLVTATVLALAYIAMAVMQIGESGKTVAQIISEGLLAFVFSYVIVMLCGYQGITFGENDIGYVETCKLHSNAVEEIDPYINYLDDWCEIKNKEALRIARRDYLNDKGFKYADIFNKDGSLKDAGCLNRKSKYSFREKIIIRSAVNIDITRLTTTLLTTHSKTKNYDPHFIGETKKDHLASGAKRSFFSKWIFALIFGYFGIGVVDTFSLANFLWLVLQASAFLGFGVLQLWLNWNYVKTDLKARIVGQINFLNEFKADYKAGRLKPLSTTLYGEDEGTAGSFKTAENGIKSNEKEIE